MKKRVFLIVLDSFGVGAAPDAAQFGDAGCSTLGRISRSPRFSCENLRSMGLGNIDGVQGVPPVPSPASCYCRMTERSAGKDTTVGHWEIAGAALLCASGAVYTGCNIENAAYTPTVCAERTAIFSAVCAGERRFCAIAVAGGMGSEPISGGAPPCGVCRQVMAEFCDSDFRILTVTGESTFREETLGALLPGAFGPHNLRSAPSDTPSPSPNPDKKETLK